MIDRLTMNPTGDGYVFSGEGTVQPILEGQIRSTAHLGWRPHRVPLGCGLSAGSPTVAIFGVILRRRPPTGAEFVPEPRQS